MAGGEMLMVFSYDVEDDQHRRRVARILENHAVRVQKSVFEAWMERSVADAVATRVAAAMGPNDSLRVYAIGDDGFGRTSVFGATPRPERQDFYLL